MFSINFNVEKSIFINKGLEQVKQILSDFNTWQTWSPWLCQEKNCYVSIANSPHTVGHSQKWQGERIGEGKMELVNIEPEKLAFTLDFVKPWKSHSKTAFSLKAQEQGTMVTWSMLGTLPFFLFFMKKMMIAWVGSDYERGLLMLKALLETGKVESDTELNEVVNKKGFSYLGIKHKCKISQMPDLMKQDFETLMNLVEEGKLDEPHQYLGLYHKFDIVNNECEFTSAFAYYNKALSYESFVTGSLPNHRAAQVVHTGAYAHLGNAWSTVMGYQRYKKLKGNKKIPWYELYLNSPNDVPNCELKTEINIPVR